MKLSEFNFEYPDALVAQAPLAERDQARLLVWDGRAETKRDSRFANLGGELRTVFSAKADVPILLIVNDSKVYPARIRVRKESGARGEVFILSPQREQDIACLLRPLKKLKTGDALLSEISGQPVFLVAGLNPPRVDNVSGKSTAELMNEFGEMPLPPYIERDPAKVADPSVAAMDKLRYQTVYAKELGSSAAPTAGLHFTSAVLNDCAEKNIVLAGVTLHVGLGTFQPVTADNIHEHEMHSEICTIPRVTMLKIVEHIKNNWPIVFVGTTSLRAVESVFLRALGYSLRDSCQQKRETLAEHIRQGKVNGEMLLKAVDEWIETDLFIRPLDKGFVYRPMCGHGMITNFHQPESTLTMLIASLVGYEQWRTIYSHAIDTQYRLFSYGDSSLLVFPSCT